MFEIITGIVLAVMAIMIFWLCKTVERHNAKIVELEDILLPEDEAEEYDCRDCFECYPGKCDEFTECKYGDGGVRCVGCENCEDGGGDE